MDKKTNIFLNIQETKKNNKQKEKEKEKIRENKSSKKYSAKNLKLLIKEPGNLILILQKGKINL